jgi:hypothetical protein
MLSFFRYVAVGRLTCVLVGVLTLAGGSRVRAVDYQREIVPILNKYCAGCHNPQDHEGSFSVRSYADLAAGGEHGPAFVAGDSAASKLIRVLEGKAEPNMPPEGEPRPNEEQVDLLRRWIDAGAAGGASPVRPALDTPRIDPSLAPKPITALAFSPVGDRLAIGRYQSIELVTPDRQFVHQFAGHPGKVNAATFGPGGESLVVATGVTGLFGETWVWDVRRGVTSHVLGGHDDAVYAVAVSPDGKWLATAGYDRRILIWDFASQTQHMVLEGHNGPIFDLAFAPNSRILASASADATVKVWDVQSGQRLDTLSQPLKEQFSVDISPDGQFIVAAGADNRLRLWRLVSIDQPQINPLLQARYAHEQPIYRVRFSRDGRRLASVSADRTTKVWDATDLTQLQVHAQASDMAEVLAWHPVNNRIYTGRMDGGLDVFESSPVDTTRPPSVQSAADLKQDHEVVRQDSPAVLAETEPNDDIRQATTVAVPARIDGLIHHAGSSRPDVDLFRFHAQEGETWMIEVQAARNGSPLDSCVRILDANGQPVPRMLLRAVRDSYFTFRGKDSMQTGDFRLHNWEEMTLNQYLYAAGEVVKLYHYPRGPDSGFNVYPNFGNRHGYFDTTPVAHALQEPCYIVEPHPPGTVLPPNGLPVFTLNFENDDECQRRWAGDSLLRFTAPSEGAYFVVLHDVRRFHGAEFQYQLAIRPPDPDFRAQMLESSLHVPQGSGRKFGVQLERIDGFAGPVTIEIQGLPDWLQVTRPIVVEAGQLRAWGTLYTRDDRTVPAQAEQITAQVFATAEIGGHTVRHPLGNWGPLKVIEPAKITIDFAGPSGNGGATSVLEIQAGTTATAEIRIQRHGESGRVSFGNEEAVVNAPHGVFVVNTGLNGVLITESENARSVFVHAEPWVQPTERLVFVEASVDGLPTSRPILLRVVPPTK